MNEQAKKPKAVATAKPAAGKQTRAARKPLTLNSGQNIVPSGSIAGDALTTVIAIMAFLACLTLGVVSLVNQTATAWQSDISREVTVQIRPVNDQDMTEAVRAASKLILEFDGIAKVTALDDEATARLLEPWLGSGLNLGELPVPRLLTITIAEGARPDFDQMRQRIEAEISGASLDDHRTWVDRLTSMAWTMVIVGIVLFGLMMAATVLTVVFATRGAMSGNKDVVEVLHFVGADSGFIASQFQKHFLVLGLKGAAAGGFAAIFLFFALGLWSSASQATPESDQLSALFGTFSLGFYGYLGIAIVIVAIAILTALTSRLTVQRYVTNLYTYQKR